MLNKTSTIKEQAFAYHANGYSVMPVGLDKKPKLYSWKKYQTNYPTDEEVLTWFEKADINIGIITGKISNISVVDIDNKNGQKQVDEMLEKFPETFTVKTGNGGYHLYYQYQEGLSISANAYPQFPNVDIRSDGGFVIAPPSVTSYNGKGGEYIVIKQIPLASFPKNLFPIKKTGRKLSTVIGVSSGGRNDSIASFIGKLLQSSPEKEWETEVYPAVLRANKTYTPPLSESEVRQTFDSIKKKEIQRRSDLIISPIQLQNGDSVMVKIRKNGNGVAYKDMANVMIVLSTHPYYKDTIKYNEFRHEIEYNGQPLEDADINKIQYFMQTDAGLHGISKEAVYSAIAHYASENKYDEVKDWLATLNWDGTERLKHWVHKATGVKNDDYHQGIGSQWFMGMIKRLMIPGSVFDYVMVLVGAQGIGKTSLFRILGGKWYKSYTGAMDNKDFYLALRGAMIVDLDEGAALYRSEAIKIKSIITETHDEFRAPYDRVMKKFARRFVFSMSTNDTEPFRDVTGNRRYWAIDGAQTIDFKWLEENRDQLFAEAYHYFINKIEVAEVPKDKALEAQERHLPDDSWTDVVVDEVRKSYDYCKGDEGYSTTIIEIYAKVFPNESIARLDKKQELRISNIFKKELGLEKIRKTIDGERKSRWYITDKKTKELKTKNIKSIDSLENF